MPSVSIAQRRFFGGVKDGAIPKPKGMTMTQVSEFASTPEKGLPNRVPRRHMADGDTWAPSFNTGMISPVPGMTNTGNINLRNRPVVKNGNRTPDAATGYGKALSASQSQEYGANPAPHLADGTNGHWMERAFKNAGKAGHSLHASLHVAKNKPIPEGKLNKALHSKDGHVQHMAQAAKNAR